MLAAVYVATDGTARIFLQGPKLWQLKHLTAGGVDPAKRFAARWCAARHLPELPAKEGARRLTGSVPLPDRTLEPFASQCTQQLSAQDGSLLQGNILKSPAMASCVAYPFSHSGAES